MNEPPEEFEELLDHLNEARRNDSIKPEQIARLEQLLMADPALRMRYRAQIRMEEELAATFETSEETSIPFPTEEERPSSRFPMWALAGIAAAIVALISLVLLSDNREEPTLTVATLEMRSADMWEGPLVLIDESRVGPGEVRLNSGTARFRFDSGALVTLEGPATLVIESPMRARLLEGKALVEAPESAHGFVISLPHGETVDLGTKFSVSVGDEGSTCEVLEGRVLIRHDESEQEEYLDDGKVMKLTVEGINQVDYQPSKTFAPEDQEWIILRTSAETTLIKHPVHQLKFEEDRKRWLNDRMLLVKMEPNSTAQRRALFNIDLAKTSGSKIASARLNLNLVPSGLGFASFLPEKITFAVYGITAEQEENWAARDVIWEKAPGYIAGDDSALDLDKVTLLGRFEINRGEQRKSCSLKTPALEEFLSNDTTGQAGFLIVRETYGTGDGSLVHAFASSIHPEASGPSLEVVLSRE